MTRSIFVVTVAFAMLIGLVDYVFAENSLDPLTRRVEDVKKLIGENPSGFKRVFSANFLAKVPPNRLIPLFKGYFKKGGNIIAFLQVKSMGPFSANYRFFTETTVFPVSISISENGPHLVEGLWFGGQSPRLAKPEDAVAAFKALPGKASFAVWHLGIGGEKPSVIASHNPDERLAIGSAFKLYILGALVKDIVDGKRRWDDVVKLRKEWRSWPSGKLQEWPDDAPVTLHTLASQMISISDNTATDHLLYILGRKHVETTLQAMGNKDPLLNRPFLSTREMFLLKYTKENKERIERYSALNEMGRRTFLDKLTKKPRPAFLELIGTPLAIGRIEWFASASDLCRAMNWLRLNSKKGSNGRHVRGILSINKGFYWSGDKWNFVGHKGGSEPGVLNLTWLAQKNDGTWLAVTGGWNNPDAALDEEKFVALLQGVILALE
ncbi:MAG: serine hydrolase [Proteobacteria bacterium]|nr:serine hydrolase [Pseudomonadota bacterium]